MKGVAIWDDEHDAKAIVAYQISPEDYERASLLETALRALLDHHEEHPDHEYGDKFRCERPEAREARRVLGDPSDLSAHEEEK